MVLAWEGFRGVGVSAQEVPAALSGARIYTAAGSTIEAGTILFQKGKITAVGSDTSVPSSATVVDLSGMETLPPNRNAPWGAWVYGIDEQGTPETIDWEQFQEPSPNKVPFSPERFFRWRCWWDYGTGLSGDLLSHEYDAVNQILDLGIPETAVSSGGIYYFKDGREVPDVWQAVCEYPDRDLTLMYSSTLANSLYRGQIFMGHDATMEVGETLHVTADEYSTRYGEKIEEDIIDPGRPMFSYNPRSGGVDAVTSASAAYFAKRGLLYTYRDGKMVNSYHLHIKEWLEAIRGNGETSCGIERGFEEAITCHMATRAYREGRKVRWDPVGRRIV